MIKTAFIIFVAALTLSATGAGKIRIVATADLHGRLTEFAKLAAVMRNYPDAFKVDAGDLTQGDPVCDLFPHDVMPEILNNLNYDIFVPGNHDFEWGIKNTQLFAKKFCGKILIGQCVDAAFPFSRWILLEKGGRRCAFIGLTEDKLISENRLLPGYSFRTDTLTVLREILKEIRAVKPYPDAVVLVWHSSFYTKFGALGQILRDFPEIDVMICAHSHRENPGMRASSALAVQPGASGSSAALIEIEFDSRGRKRATSRLLRPAKEGDREVTAVWKKSAKAAEEKLSEKLYEISSADEFKKLCAAKIMEKCSAGAVLLENRELKKRGIITAEDIMKAMPYSNRICLVETDAAALKTMNENKNRRYILFPSGRQESKIILAVNDYLLRSSPDLQKYKNSAVPTPFYEREIILDMEKKDE